MVKQSRQSRGAKPVLSNQIGQNRVVKQSGQHRVATMEGSDLREEAGVDRAEDSRAVVQWEIT